MTDKQKTILLVEDDLELAELVSRYLTNNHFSVSQIHDGADAASAILDQQPDIVILDLMLPNQDGISICREIRPDYSGPVLMLTASSESVDEIVGLEIGADDYVKKPVEPRLLLARLKALLRRTNDNQPQQGASGQKPEVMQFNKLSINLSARTVTLQDQALALSVPEFETLLFLAQHAGNIVSRDQLFQHLKNIDYDGQSRFVDIIMSSIRKQFGDAAEQYLKTVRGKGYLLVLN